MLFITAKVKAEVLLNIRNLRKQNYLYPDIFQQMQKPTSAQAAKHLPAWVYGATGKFIQDIVAWFKPRME